MSKLFYSVLADINSWNSKLVKLIFLVLHFMIKQREALFNLDEKVIWTGRQSRVELHLKRKLPVSVMSFC